MQPTVAQLLAELDAHCDVRERAVTTPRSARIRGLYFQNIERVLATAGKLRAYRAMFPARISALRWYPVGDYVVNLAVAGALLETPARVHQGMERIGFRYSTAVVESLIGRALLRLLDPDPRRLLEQGLVGRRQTTAYGLWELQFVGPQRAIMSMSDEYIWIESNLLGAAKGTFAAIDVPVIARAEMESPLVGRIVLDW